MPREGGRNEGSIGGSTNRRFALRGLICPNRLISVGDRDVRYDHETRRILLLAVPFTCSAMVDLVADFVELMIIAQ